MISLDSKMITEELISKSFVLFIKNIKDFYGDYKIVFYLKVKIKKNSCALNYQLVQSLGIKKNFINKIIQRSLLFFLFKRFYIS